MPFLPFSYFSWIRPMLMCHWRIGGRTVVFLCSHVLLSPPLGDLLLWLPTVCHGAATCRTGFKRARGIIRGKYSRCNCVLSDLSGLLPLTWNQVSVEVAGMIGRGAPSGLRVAGATFTCGGNMKACHWRCRTTHHVAMASRSFPRFIYQS